MELLLTAFLYVCVIVIVSLRVQNILNPVSVALGPLATAMLILVLDPLDYGYPSVDMVTAMLLALYGIMFSTPFLICKLSSCSDVVVHSQYEYSFVKLRIVAGFLLVVGLLAYYLKLVMILNDNNVPFSIMNGLEFFKNNIYIVEHSIRKGYSLLHYVGCLGLVYSAYVFARGRKLFCISNIGIGLLSIAYLISLIALFSKVQFIIGVALFFFTYATLGGRGWRFSALLVVLVGGGITLVDNYMYSGDINVSIEFLFRYIAGSIIGLDNYLGEESFIQSFGAHTLQPVYVILERIGIDVDYRVVNNFYVINKTGAEVNTGTILLGPYLDYGMFGVVFLCLFLSVISYWLMRRMHANGSVVYILSYSIVLTVLVVGFIGGIYNHIEFVLIYIVHILLEFSGVIIRKNNRVVFRGELNSV
ncbi:MAG: O-antigen polymerase [Methylococcales bacterium]